MTSPTPPTGPLSDFRVLDLADESGVFAGRLLAQLGADVIRIEPPDGDGVRRRRPFLGDREGPEASLYHLHFNVNKRGITLDFRRPEGAALFERLVAASAALIETFAPGEMDSIGLGYERLRELNRSLLYVSITPFGQEGPMRHYRANDLIGAAMSGVMWLNGLPEDPPNQPGAEQAYHMASLAAASGLLLALVGRDRRTDRSGHRIDVSIQEAASMATIQTANANSYTWYGRIPSRHGLGVFGGRSLFQCADGLWISFTVPPYRWDEFLQWLDNEGIESEIRSEEWRDQAHRVQHPGGVAAAIEKLAIRHKRSELFHEGQRRRLLVLAVNTVQDIAEDEQLRARKFFVDIAGSDSASALLDSGPVGKMTATPLAFRRPAPKLGEHNREVYCDLLGLSESELAGLEKAGIV